MPRSFSAILACVFLVSCLAIGIGAAPVQAATAYKLDAQPNGGGTGYLGSFSLEYLDGTRMDECRGGIIPGSFTGVWDSANGEHNLEFFTTVEYVPTFGGPWGVAPFPFSDVAYGQSGQIYPAWTFTGCTGWYYSKDLATRYNENDPDLVGNTEGDGWYAWNYTQSPVPIPPSVFLLGAGLMGLAVARRKKRSGP